MLDNCSTHPPAATLIRGNIHVMYLPPNDMSILQPMDQEIIEGQISADIFAKNDRLLQQKQFGSTISKKFYT